MAVFYATIILLIQSRFNILASFIFSFFLIINIKNLNLIKKFIYFLTIIILPLIIFNTFSTISSRFVQTDGSNEIIVSEEKNFSFRSEKIQNDILNNPLVSEKYPLLKEYTSIFENFKILEDKANKSSNTDSMLYSKLFYKQILILQNEVEIIEAENKIKKDVIIEEVLVDIRNFFSVYRGIVFLKCSKTLETLDRLSTGRICGWEILLKNIEIKNLFFGEGYFADQIYLKNVHKTSSNSWINILFNAGIVSLFVYAALIFIFFFRFFSIKNINHKKFYLSISHYFFLYFIARSMFEDTIAFVGIDFLMLSACMLIIAESKKLNY
jgi:hypothetical protein